MDIPSFVKVIEHSTFSAIPKHIWTVFEIIYFHKAAVLPHVTLYWITVLHLAYGIGDGSQEARETLTLASNCFMQLGVYDNCSAGLRNGVCYSYHLHAAPKEIHTCFDASLWHYFQITHEILFESNFSNSLCMDEMNKCRYDREYQLATGKRTNCNNRTTLLYLQVNDSADRNNR